MSQMHFYVPDDVEEQVRQKAKEANLPVSRYLAELVKRETAPNRGWPAGYFKNVFGKWAGEPLQRGAEGDLEQREPFK